MASIPAKVSSRLVAGIKRFQPILSAAKARDVNESDTVVIINDMLQEVFGFDKYTEITSEFCVRGTYCDLAVKVEGAPVMLIEVKSIGLELKDAFVKQAVDYAANLGVDWVVLTTGVVWRVYRVTFSKPIDFEVVVSINFLELNPRTESDLDMVWLLTKESWQRSMLSDHYAQKQALNRFVLAALMTSDSIVATLRRELRQISPGVKIDCEEIRAVLVNEVLKRDVLEGEKAQAAKRMVTRKSNRAGRAKNGRDAQADAPGDPAQTLETQVDGVVETAPSNDA